jgi:hypothetical protein
VTRDNGRQIGGKAGAAFEAAQGLVVVVNQLELNAGDQFLDFVVTQPMPTRDTTHHVVEQRKIVRQQTRVGGFRGRDARMIPADPPGVHVSFGHGLRHSPRSAPEPCRR